MFSKKEKQIELPHEKTNQCSNGLVNSLTLSIALYALMRQGNYRVALSFYKHGGGGLNFYKKKVTDKEIRVFGIDYHSFWDSKANQSVCRLHCHYGRTESQRKKHRPYQGGWL